MAGVGRAAGRTGCALARVTGAARRRFSSSSDKARSFFIISAFSHFSARLGFANSFITSMSTKIASTPSAIMNPVLDRPIMDAASFVRSVNLDYEIQIVLWWGIRKTGYQGSWPRKGTLLRNRGGAVQPRGNFCNELVEVTLYLASALRPFHPWPVLQPRDEIECRRYCSQLAQPDRRLRAMTVAMHANLHDTLLDGEGASRDIGCFEFPV